MKKIILASASPRRKELLEKIGVEFEVIQSEVDEVLEFVCEDKTKFVQLIAAKKARYVADMTEKGIIIAADTIVSLGDKTFGKPEDDDEAFVMLSALSGVWHQVITGVVFIDVVTKEEIIRHEVTKVKFAHLEPSSIREYIQTGEPFGKAGSYAIQSKGAMFVEKVEGCYFNIIGLPIKIVYEGLEHFGVNYINKMGKIRY